MNLESFNALTDAEKNALLESIDANNQKLSDLEAERNSLLTENNSLKETTAKQTEELKQAKELNFTLARNVGNHKPTDPEETLYKFIKGE